MLSQTKEISHRNKSQGQSPFLNYPHSSNNLVTGHLLGSLRLVTRFQTFKLVLIRGASRGDSSIQFVFCLWNKSFGQQTHTINQLKGKSVCPCDKSARVNTTGNLSLRLVPSCAPCRRLRCRD